MGVCVSCDSFKMKSNGRKFYDLVMKCLQLFRKSVLQGGVISCKICTRLLYVTHHVEAEIVECIRNTLSQTLKTFTGCGLRVFEKNFTFVNDWTAVMEKVFGASVSSNSITNSLRLVGFVSHKLNTVIKTVIESLEMKSWDVLKHFGGCEIYRVNSEA